MLTSSKAHLYRRAFELDYGKMLWWKDSTHQLIQSLDQVFSSQVRVALQHLHGLVAGYGGDFLIAKARFYQARDSLVAQVVEAQVGDLCILDDLFPCHAEFIRPAFAVVTGFATEDEVGIEWARGIGERLA